MPSKVFLAIFLILAIGTASSAQGQSDVGVIRVTNTDYPEKAWRLKRGRDIITPTELRFAVRSGDLVMPNEGYSIIFQPRNQNCPPMAITAVTEMTVCEAPLSAKRRKRLIFVPLEGSFAMAEEVEHTIATSRGDDDGPYTLPVSPLKIFLETRNADPASVEELKKLMSNRPFLEIVDQSNQAETVVSLSQKTGPVIKLTALKPVKIERIFSLPNDRPIFLATMQGLINYKAISTLVSPGDWPDLALKVIVNQSGNKRIVEDRLTILQNMVYHHTRPVDMYFDLDNKSRDTYYAYIINYNDQGQIRVFRTRSENNWVKVPGRTVGQFPSGLQTREPVENIRLVISQVPLDLSQFEQPDWTGPDLVPGFAVNPIENAHWYTMTLTAVKDQK